jgi:hypothetical protein
MTTDDATPNPPAESGDGARDAQPGQPEAASRGGRRFLGGFFLPPGVIGRLRHMTDEDISELAKQLAELNGGKPLFQRPAGHPSRPAPEKGEG